jgi:Peptidase S46
MGNLSTGTFVSPRGLIVANHYNVRSCIGSITRTGEDLLTHGFYAANEQDERQCPNAEAAVLTSIEDVTRTIREAAANASEDARSQAMAEAERVCTTSELRCQIVSLHAGALHHLYRYRVYKDVRLVFAPESLVAYYPGNDVPGNFPHWDMTLCFLRVGENNQPAKAPAYLPWNTSGRRDGQLVFQSSNPRTTDRARPVSFLEVDRDITLLLDLVLLEELSGILEADPSKQRDSHLHALVDSPRPHWKVDRRGSPFLRSESDETEAFRGTEDRRSHNGRSKARVLAAEARSRLDRAAGEYRKIAKGSVAKIRRRTHG